jgi:hypothetical protein
LPLFWISLGLVVSIFPKQVEATNPGKTQKKSKGSSGGVGTPKSASF